MVRKARDQRGRRKGNLSCAQIGLIFLIVVILAMGVAVILGYALGIFDELLTGHRLSSPQATTLAFTETSIEVNQVSATPRAAIVTATEALVDLGSPTPATPTPLESGSTPGMPTQTPSITPTPPADVCSRLNLSFLNATSNVATWRLDNGSSIPLTLAHLQIAWPNENDAIFNAFLDGKVIWSGEDLSSPTTIDQWMGEPDDRVVTDASRLEFYFGIMAATSGYDLTLRFGNGCEVSASN
jgi:hypothetical protein